ncbi:MAG: hypothetical protein EOM23_01245 [Candidatus Moranbacteria bacterium]|nr:hypothetical protein [Candidatus Moranbacteria bacterium]
MTTKQTYWLLRLLNFTFRLVIPAIAAGVIWGLFKKDVAETTFLDQVAGGSFVIIILTFAEIKDMIVKQLEQLKLDNRVSFMKNRAFLFLGLGVVLVLVKMFADKAIDFFFIAGASNVVAYACEYFSNRLYRKLNPLSLGVGLRG